MRKRRFIVGAVSLFALAISGCARIHIACPTNGIEHAMIGGNNVGTVAITALMSMGSKAGLMAERVGAAAPAPGTPNTATTVDYTYAPIFGTDYVECGQGPLPK